MCNKTTMIALALLAIAATTTAQQIGKQKVPQCSTRRYSYSDDTPFSNWFYSERKARC